MSTHTDREQWADDHGYRLMRCPHCGWYDYTDGDAPECGCFDGEGDGARCAFCDETQDNCRCDLGFMVETFSRQSKVRTARKDHKGGRIKAGDRYYEVVTGGYHKDGPRWMSTHKVKVSQ